MSRIVPTVLAISDLYVEEYKKEYESEMKLLAAAPDRNDLQAVSDHAAKAEFCRFAVDQYSQVRIKHQNRSRS